MSEVKVDPKVLCEKIKEIFSARFLSYSDRTV